MKIALCHFRVGETDGVSLEMDKWKKALEQNGHEVFYIAGSSGNCEAEIIKSLHYKNEENLNIVQKAYGDDVNGLEKELEKQIFDLADTIEKELLTIINTHKPDVIVPNNILSLGWGLSAGIAFYRAIKNSGVKAICHHHDFHWERDLYSSPIYDFVRDILQSYFPPVDDNIQHVCINHLAKNELKKRFNIDATVVPNVFDFEQNLIAIDNYNQDLRSSLGIKPNDLVFLQATRVVERKGIELAIDLIAELNKITDQPSDLPLYNGQSFTADSKIYLVLAGMVEDEPYYDLLLSYAEEKNVQLINASDSIDHQRRTEEGKKIYSLWDAYTMADIVTYPSILEGWGNQFIEALVAKIPVVTYEYPVYGSDIAQYNFNIISLGNRYKRVNKLASINPQTLLLAVKETIRFLINKDHRILCVQENYNIANQHLSVKALSLLLKKLF
ncbi:MAG: glycosyltransferase family 4 protein [Carboxylicivirga sp.]|jgi:glycosyltransferase involved in cell wall biosynthesis|nr:glycosyltransferase family 4 protein [Carboxylicivirga sp.]